MAIGLATPERAEAKLAKTPDMHVNWISSIPFLALHGLALFGVLMWWDNRKAWVLLAVSFFVRMFFLTGGYHRYFSHKSYKLNRFSQFVFAFAGTTAAQKGPLWWAAHHRNHHRFSDADGDVHSPKLGFWWSHVGWILCDKYGDTEWDRIPDLAKYPELVWVNKWNMIGPWALAIFSFLYAGLPGLFIGFFASTVLLWHGTFTINSLAHVWGRRRYATSDTSRNNWFLALFTGGEGWHNNHHHYMYSARQGFYWWEYDTTFYTLWLLAKIGIVRELRGVPREKRESDLIKPA